MNTALPDADARAAALDLGCNPLVMAPAGSGKTGLLVQRLLRALAVVDAPEQVLAITFTNKAAAEIRERVLHWLHLAQSQGAANDDFSTEALNSARAVLVKDREQNWNLLSQPDRLSLRTIDSFCNQLAVQVPLLSGLGGAVQVAEDPAALYLEAILALFAELDEGSLAPEDEDALRRVLRAYGNRIDSLVEPLSGLLAAREQWLSRLESFHAPGAQAREDDALCAMVESCLAEFSAALGAHCANLVAVLQEGAFRSDKLAWAKDLSAWPEPEASCLDTYRKLAGLLLTTTDGDLRKPGGVKVTGGFEKGALYTARFKQVLAGCAGSERIARAAQMVLRLPEPFVPADTRGLRDAWLRLLKRLSAHLRVVFGRSGQTDFAQIAESAGASLRPEGGYGDALLAADRQIRHLLVDEMQDTSEAQLQLFLQLTQTWTEGDGRSLFLVGDPQQSIYGFRKAEVRLFLELWERERLGAVALKPLRLSANFRSAPEVVNWFNTAFTRIFPQAPDIERGAVAFSASAAMRFPSKEGGVRLRVFSGKQDLLAADAAAELAARLIAQGGKVAVLAHARHHLQPVIQALRLRGVAAACQDLDPLAALPDVADYLALVRALWHPQDRLCWAVLLRAPFVGMSWSDLLALSRARAYRSWPERIAEELEPRHARDRAFGLSETDSMSVSDQAKRHPVFVESPAAVVSEGLDSRLRGNDGLNQRYLSDEGRLRLQRLAAAIQDSARSPSLRADLAARAEFVWETLGGRACLDRAGLADVREAQACVRAHTRSSSIRDLAALERALKLLYAAPRAGEVQLMTVHKSKGLEFDHVLLVGAHRKPKSEARAPLCLRRLGRTELLVPAPDPAWPDDHPARGLYEFVHRQHVESRRNEALRLLYVAITRARDSATLFLCTDFDAKGEPVFARNSFAQRLAPAILDEVRAAMPAASAGPLEERRELPRAPRLPSDFRMPPDADLKDLYVPALTRTARPSAAVLAMVEEPEHRRQEGEVYAQLVGTLYHEALARIASEGLSAWADGGASRGGALAAGLRRRGLPEPQIIDAVSRVLALVARTLAGTTGRWLLENKSWAVNEYPLAGFDENRWISAVIDRCFEDADGRIWVIDYKTAAHPVPVAELEIYLTRGAEQYRAQVAEYLRLMRALKPGREVRGALYFAEADRLIEVAAVEG